MVRMKWGRPWSREHSVGVLMRHWSVRRDPASNIALERTAGSQSLAAAVHRFLRPFAGFLLTLALAVAPLAPEAQQARKAWRIGYLGAGSPPPPSAQPSPLRSAFRQGLRELGYTEGHHITIEYRWGEGKADRLPGLAAELVNLKVDVMFAASLQAGGARRQGGRQNSPDRLRDAR